MQCTASLQPGETCSASDLLFETDARDIYLCVGPNVTHDAENQACDERCTLKPVLENMSRGSLCTRAGDVEPVWLDYEAEESKKCVVADEGDLITLVPDPPYTVLQIDENRSRMSIDVDGYDGSQKIVGQVGLAGANCPGATCGITLANMVLHAPHFKLKKSWDPIPIHIPFFFGLLLDSANGTVHPDGHFVFPGSEIRMLTKLRATKKYAFQNTYFNIVTDQEVNTGSLDFANREFRFETSISEGNLDVDISVVANWANLPPLVRGFAESTAVECDAPGTGTVRLWGEASDADGFVEGTQWVIDRILVSKELETEQHLSLGEHVVSLFARDDDGAWSQHTFNVSVVDTTPPVLGPGEGAIYCTWRPNHKYVRLAIEDQVLAFDVCDPNPAVVFLDAWSDEPEYRKRRPCL